MTRPALSKPAPSDSVALSVRDVKLSFGGLRALDGVSFDVAPGRVTGLVGPNGAGKTTLFNVVSGLHRAQSGAITYAGRRIEGESPHRITQAGLVRTFQIARGFPALTVFEHLMVYGVRQPGESLMTAILGSAAARRREAELAETALAVARRLRLSHVIDNRVTDLSGGQKKLLEIGRALMAEPGMILFDEPAAGVNPTLAEEIGDELLALAAEGMTVLLIEHDMALIERLCRHVVVMARGRTLAEGTFDEVRENREVQDAYLGGRR
ncbi:branched-chain amino acid transport system ATP-binding protein [Methylobacterium sp. 174MFSha1.1]|uniref:ABC transporter ATP-binding protein n=1 Tax=Methylobacterium sp. 174MFSha1.1 TaxID=1502749 RepID=UPI0008F37C20|nr:ABC transporter ATP-binding protein [Methylobacterium sp. 174MFSha1.1]SFU47947.1 branched-chain amino acid transport system ATP-binding protein [Methylobacterium sp. 174MFSha1.1]